MFATLTVSVCFRDNKSLKTFKRDIHAFDTFLMPRDAIDKRSCSLNKRSASRLFESKMNSILKILRFNLLLIM